MLEVDCSFSQVCEASLPLWIKAGAQLSIQGDIQDISGRPQIFQTVVRSGKTSLVVRICYMNCPVLEKYK